MSVEVPDLRTPTASRKPGLRDAAVALREPNFARFWFGALLSNTGTWMQQAAVPFVLFEMTGSATWVGFAAFAQLIPAWLMGPLGGSLADRFPRRTILILTQAAMAGLALVLWSLFATDVATPATVVAVVAVHGIFGGLNIPAWQAFVSELVPRRILLNAVTLNSAQFNAAKALGPASAGIVLATLGVDWAFFLNGASYVFVLVALWSIRLPPRDPARAGQRPGIAREFGETLRYVRARPEISVCVLVVFFLSFLGGPVFTLVKVFTDDVFRVGETAFGLMSASLGFGAILGTPIIAGWGSGLRRSRLLRGSLMVYSAALVGFALAPVFAVGVIGLTVAGAGYLAIASTLNTAIQLAVDESMRGKVMALYLMGLTASLPVGSLGQGALADLIGPRATVAGAGVLLAIVGLWLGWARSRFDVLDLTC